MKRNILLILICALLLAGFSACSRVENDTTEDDTLSLIEYSEVPDGTEELIINDGQ